MNARDRHSKPSRVEAARKSCESHGRKRERLRRFWKVSVKDQRCLVAEEDETLLMARLMDASHSFTNEGCGRTSLS